MKNITSWKTICIHNENLISNYEELLEMIGRSITQKKKRKKTIRISNLQKRKYK